MSMQAQKRDWESLAKLDPCWAILTDPSRQYGRWKLEDFFQVGETEIEAIWARVRQLGHPKGFGQVLDFGCGLGRLTRPLSRHFDKAVGVDISEAMVQQGRELHAEFSNISFLVNASDDLSVFPDQNFDMIYTRVVLQHLPSRAAIFKYLREFARLLNRGGLLVFQLPSHIPWLLMLQPRRRLYQAFQRLGCSEGFLYRRLRLNPMRMTYIAEPDVLRFLEENGLRVLEIERSHIETPFHMPLENRTYFCTPTR